MGSLRFYHGGQVDDVVLSPDGKMAASTGGWGVRLWDAATGRELPLAEGLRQATLLAAGGRLLGVKVEEGGLRLVDLVANKEVGRLALGKRFMNSFGLSPDGKTLVLWGLEADLRPTLRFCDVPAGRVGPAINLKQAEQVTQFAFSADGRTLVLRYSNATVHVWDVAARTERRAAGPGEADFGGTLALAPDGRTLAVAPPGKPILLLDTRTFRELPSFPDQPKEHVNHLAFSPDGKLLAATYPGPWLRLWDVASRKEARKFRGKDYQVFRTAFSADGRTLAGADGASVTLWDVATGQYRPVEGPPSRGHTYSVDALDFSPDGTTLVSGAGYNDPAVRVWDPLTGRPKGVWHGHASGIEVVAYAPGGAVAASGSQDGTVRLWDPRTGKEVNRLEAHDSMVYAMAFAPDGKTIAAGGARKPVHLWDVATGREVRSLGSPGAWVQRLAFSPDGKLLATADADRAIRLWDAAGGTVVRTLRAPPAGWPSLSFSPGGKLLAAGADDGTVRLWDPATGAEVRGLGEPKKPEAGEFCRTLAAAFSPDGRSLAAGYDDGTVRLWEVASRGERVRFAGHRSSVGFLAFCPDGSLLASGSSDRTIVVWDLTGERTAARPPRDGLRSGEGETLWAGLTGDAAGAYAAIRRLRAAGPEGVALLKGRLRPATPIDAGRVARLVRQLDDDQFAVRGEAARALGELGDRAEPALRRALEGKPSPELRRRVAAILESIDANTREHLRQLRTVEVLEHSGGAGARQVLEEWAKGAPETRLTREARAALERLARRPTAGP
jgi:WD40 repeat protein